jgi:hypothetical protein
VEQSKSGTQHAGEQPNELLVGLLSIYGSGDQFMSEKESDLIFCKCFNFISLP